MRNKVYFHKLKNGQSLKDSTVIITGESTIPEQLVLDGCNFVLEGAARNTVLILQSIYESEGGDKLVDEFFEAIKKGRADMIRILHKNGA